MALIKLDEDGPGTAAGKALRLAEAEIAELTGNARSTYRLAKDRERDEEALREMVEINLRDL